MKPCIYCNKEFFTTDKRKTFCSRSCACSFNNKKSPKRKKTNCCKECNTAIHSQATFCADCFKSLATIKNGTFCVVCNFALTGKQKHYCSKACKLSVHSKSCYEKQQLRAYKRKSLLVASKGGKCETCGYSKCLAALEFHHLDPRKKDFSLDARKMSGTRWKTLLEEASKCKLLCSNCHREHHWSTNNPTSTL